jgi:hypothetical protein
MSIGREQIYSALFNLLTPLGQDSADQPPVFATVSRRPVPISQLTPEMLPALFQCEAGEKYEFKNLMLSAPPVITLYADLYVVQYFSDAVAFEATPSTVVNNLMDTVEDALQQPGGVDNQTLSDLVEYARLEGRMTEWQPSSEGRWAISAMRVALLVNH